MTTLKKPITLPELRFNQGRMTQSQLAGLLDVTTGAVGNWEAGIRVPRLPMIRRIAEVFGVEPGDIYFPGEAKDHSSQTTKTA